LEEYFHPDINKDPDARIFFNDIKLAYDTLSNEQSRMEYDDYMNTCYKYATMWMHLENQEEQERLKAIEERRRKRLERMRSQVHQSGNQNEEFFSNW
jgi:DnaJ-class molecular chaperone